MQASFDNHLVMKLFVNSLPKLTHLGYQRWKKFNHRSWEREVYEAQSVDRNNTLFSNHNGLRSTLKAKKKNFEIYNQNKHKAKRIQSVIDTLYLGV